MEQQISFRVYEYVGTEIYKGPGNDPLIKEGDLAVGDTIRIWHGTATVTEVDGRSATARGNALLCFLKFAEDDRNCWICVGSANPRALNAILGADSVSSKSKP